MSADWSTVMEYEDDLLPVSALQHLVFCPRQCALIHVEREWAENRLTAEGSLLHARVQSGETTTRGALRVLRAVPLVSYRLGITGYADVVEIHRADSGAEAAFPVEYKRGRTKSHDADRVQLCAQALCIEEMMGLSVPEGALFYGAPRRRETVIFDEALRTRTEALAGELRHMVANRIVPPPRHGPHCRSCSLAEICRPTLRSGRSASAWTERMRVAT
jgi:CRISPR-associated exonuclease Cas4